MVMIPKGVDRWLFVKSMFDWILGMPILQEGARIGGHTSVLYSFHIEKINE